MLFVLTKTLTIAICKNKNIVISPMYRNQTKDPINKTKTNKFRHLTINQLSMEAWKTILQSSGHMTHHAIGKG